jgi:hypothetical protein
MRTWRRAIGFLAAVSCGGAVDTLGNDTTGPSLDGGGAVDGVADGAPASDGRIGDASFADLGVGDTSVADTSAADRSVADTGVPDTSVADVGIRDTTVVDTTPLDVTPPADARDSQGEACGEAPVVMPTFSPPPGTIMACGALNVTMSTPTPGTSIFYTLDGTNPTPASLLYSHPLSITTLGTTVIRAYATAPCLRDSPVSVGVYNVEFPQPVQSPVPSRLSGAYGAGFDLSLSAPGAPGATICYTLDGSMPQCSSGVCTAGATYDAAAGILIDSSVTKPTTGAVTVNALACSSGACSSSSLITQVNYVLQLDPVAFAPPLGTALSGGELLGMQITRNGPASDQPYQSICWSVDATQPDCTCSGATPENARALVGRGLYVSTGDATPVMQVAEGGFASGITVKAVGCATGWAPSLLGSSTWSCSCRSGLINCGGAGGCTCVDPNIDNANCGGCGIVCPIGDLCESGMCSPVIPFDAGNDGR